VSVDADTVADERERMRAKQMIFMNANFIGAEETQMKEEEGSYNTNRSGNSNLINEDNKSIVG